MGYCEQIPNCQRPDCGHEACGHDTEHPHGCLRCSCSEFVFPEGMNESQFQGGGGSSGGGGASGSW